MKMFPTVTMPDPGDWGIHSPTTAAARRWAATVVRGTRPWRDWPEAVPEVVLGATLAVAVGRLLAARARREHLAGAGPGPILLALLSVEGLALLLRRRAVERRRAGLEQEQVHLRDELASVQALLNSAELGIFMYDADQRFCVFNRQLADWLQVEPSQVLGQPADFVIDRLIAPRLAEPAALGARHRRAIERPSEVSYEEFEQVRPVRRVLRLHSGPVYQGGVIIGRMGVVTDVTASYEREAERQALNEVSEALSQELTLDRVAAIIVTQVQRLLGSAAVGLWTVNRATGELRLLAEHGFGPDAQARAATMHLAEGGALAASARSGPPLEAAGPPDLGGDIGALQQLAMDQGWSGVEWRPLYGRGRFVGVLASFSRALQRFSPRDRRVMDTLARFSAIAIDHAMLFQEAWSRTREAEEARRSLQRFLGMVSHDLRNPVAIVLGYAQVLHLRAGERNADEGDVRAIQAIERASRQMGRLIDDLLIAARIGIGQFEIKPAPMDLVAVLQRVIAQHQETTSAHQLILEAPPHVEGTWDVERITQVWSNLVSNAIKYSPQGGLVRVVVQPADGEVTACISDQGTGIPAEGLDKLFHPFTRLVEDETIRGVGLGLYICKAIVEAHHGRIWATSQVGHGSTFCVALPGARSEPSSPAPSGSP